VGDGVRDIRLQNEDHEYEHERGDGRHVLQQVDAVQLLRRVFEQLALETSMRMNDYGI